MDIQQPVQQPSEQPINQQPIQPVPMVTRSPQNSWKIIISVVVGVLVLGGASYGAYYWQTQNKPVVAPIDETANWQTYKNEQYGFEVKYPEEWLIVIDSTSTSSIIWRLSIRPKFRKGSNEWPQLSITNNLDPSFLGNLGNKIYNTNSFSLEKTLPEGGMAIQTSRNEKKIHAVCVLYLSELYELPGSKIITLCNQILSTFKFTSQ